MSTEQTYTPAMVPIWQEQAAKILFNRLGRGDWDRVEEWRRQSFRLAATTLADAGLLATRPTEPPMPSEETLARAAETMRQHYLNTMISDADGNNPCACGNWGEGPDLDWDDHMAAVLDREGLLADRAQARPTEPGRDSETLAKVRGIVDAFGMLSERGQQRQASAFSAILDVLAASPAQEPAGEGLSYTEWAILSRDSDGNDGIEDCYSEADAHNRAARYYQTLMHVVASRTVTATEWTPGLPEQEGGNHA